MPGVVGAGSPGGGRKGVLGAVSAANAAVGVFGTCSPPGLVSVEVLGTMNQK